MRFDRLRVGGSLGNVPTWGKSAQIISIQSGTITLAGGVVTNTATIAAVDVAQAEVVVTGERNDGTDSAEDLARATLTNATTVTVTRHDATGGVNVVVVGYQVIWYRPGLYRSIQYGTITIPTVTATGTATVASVNTAKCRIEQLGCTLDIAVSPAEWGATLVVTNATTVTAERSSAATAVCIVGFVLLEGW